VAQSTGGTALVVQSRARFSQSGFATAGAGRTSIEVTGVSLLSSSGVLTTIQGVNTGNLYVTSVETMPSQSKFVIYFNQAVPGGTTLKIAWLVLTMPNPRPGSP
jgi:hypothetical protein